MYSKILPINMIAYTDFTFLYSICIEIHLSKTIYKLSLPHRSREFNDLYRELGDAERQV